MNLGPLPASVVPWVTDILRPELTVLVELREKKRRVSRPLSGAGQYSVYSIPYLLECFTRMSRTTGKGKAGPVSRSFTDKHVYLGRPSRSGGQDKTRREEILANLSKTPKLRTCFFRTVGPVVLNRKLVKKFLTLTRGVITDRLAL
jgi:hypothetical protein